MLDDHTDKAAARHQVLAIVLMTALVFIWFQFFMPHTPPVEEAPPPAEVAEDGIPRRELPERPDAPESEVADAWPELPPEAEPRDPSDDAVIIENEDLRLVFTRVGARLREAHLKLRHHGESEVQLVPQTIRAGEPLPDTEAIYPLGLSFSNDDLGDALDRRRFEARPSADGRAVVFSIEIPGMAVVEKTFSLDEREPVLRTAVTYRNLSEQEVRLGRDYDPAYELTWAPDIAAPEEGHMGVRKSVIWRKEGQNTASRVDRLERQPERAFNVDWIALRTAYFVVGMKPEYEGAVALAHNLGGGETLRFGLAAPRMTLASGEAATQEFRVYIGPSHAGMMAAAWETLPTVQRFFESFDLMDRFAKLLLSLLNWFYGIIPNYGVAIILLTILVRGGMFPLTIKSMKSMKRMQALAPEMQALKEKYGEDQQELNKKMMELYRERGANPFGSCLPLLLQMPIFIALYRMLWSAYELRGAPFTLFRFGDYHWISDLSQPDRLIHLPFLADVPLIGQTFEYFNILPILGALAILASQKLMPTAPVQNDQQKIIMNIMPIFMAFLFYRMAAGLNLYILVSTVLGILQNKLVHLSPEEAAAPPPKKGPKKKRSFYAAAQDKKRRMAKESKAAKKRNPNPGDKVPAFEKRSRK